MAHIVQFTVNGLAGRKNPVHLKLDRHVNVVFGVNGSGKTSILRILDSAMTGEVSPLANIPFEKAEVIIHSMNEDCDFTYTFDATAFNEVRQSELELTSEQGSLTPVARRVRLERMTRMKLEKGWTISPNPKGTKRWQHTFLPVSRLYPQAVRGESARSESDLDKAFEQDLAQHWVTYFSRIQSQVRKIQQEGLAEILSEVLLPKNTEQENDRLAWETAYAQTVSFLQRQGANGQRTPSAEQFQARYKNEALVRNVVQQIDGIERRITEAMSSRSKLQLLLDKLFSGRKKIAFNDTSVDVISNEKNIGIRSLSSGEKHLLRILFEVINVEQSSLLIDEPEISLHIDWQRALVQTLRELNPRAQLILASHSPEVMAEVPDANIFALD